MENNKTPSIRFKGFTDPWEQRKLEDIVGIYDGVHQTPNYQNSGVMFLSVENIATLKSSKFISEEDFKRDYKVFPQENDILMTRIGDVGTTNVVTDNGLKAYYVSLALLKYKSTDPYFLSNAIQSDYVQKELANRTLKTAIPMKINKDEIGKVSVMLPLSATEQQQIGTYFRNLDDLITLHQRKYNKLLNVKKSMLEKMFPKNESNIPEIRFKGFTDPWEQRKLSECAGFRRGSFPQPYGNKDWYDGEGAMPFVQVADVASDMQLVEDTKQKISKLAQPMSVFAEKGSVLVTLQGSIGRVAITQYGAFVDRTVLIFDKYAENIDKRFWAYIIKEKFEDEARKAPGGTIKTITKEALSAFELKIPSYKEQGKLADYLIDLDHLITLHQRELEKLQNIKKFMLEKMFV